MSKKVGIEVSIAAAEAVGLARADVIAAYPITPQTHIVEHLAELVATGKLDAEYVAVESEHSAISASMGASAAGARSFTATASQGLALMHEILFAASSMRLPIVMAVANRAISAPINIWADHSDIMPQRDTGWVQLFAENGQEVVDLIFQAFKLAEDHSVLLPVMVNMDGFTLSHVIEPVSLLDPKEVDSFLPELKPFRMLDPEIPRTMGPFGAQDVYTEIKQQQESALINAESVMQEIWVEYADMFGRTYHSVETYKTKDADIILVTMGAVGETARSAVDEMREQGILAGLASVRMWRPFPAKKIIKALKNVKKIVVMDRTLCFGSQGGPLANEIRTAFYNQKDAPKVINYVAGLGGREISRATFKEMVAKASCTDVQSNNYELLDVRNS
ncbi:MAG: transketolase C-terminal domain-containing protein [Thermodesulfobacteriota bacterium]